MDRTKEHRKPRKPPLQISVNTCQAHLVYRVQNIETDICEVRSGKGALTCTRCVTVTGATGVINTFIEIF